jgi:hypothetical protein
MFRTARGIAGAVRQNLAMVPSDSTPGPDGERDVFGSLPNARPQRRSAKRDRAGGRAKPAKPQSATPEAKPAPRPTSKARTAAKPRATAPTPEAKPAPRATPKARAATKPRAAAKARPAAKPRATAAAASEIPPAGYATARADDDRVPRGTDLVTTAVQAAGELAQIGLAAGGRALKSALERLPRP